MVFLISLLVLLFFNINKSQTAFTTNYIIVDDNSLTWDEAESYCNNQYGSNLATITTPEENSELLDAVESVCGSSCFVWIGLSGVDCNFTWSSGSTSNYSDYGTGEPDHCSYIPSTDPYCIVASTSGDYWGDWYCNDPGNVVAAFACDQPSNALHTDNFIVVDDNSLTWSEAEDFCVSNYGTNLATITSVSQDEEARNGVQHFCGNSCFAWIGLSGVDCNFTWSSGSDTNFTNYGTGEPDHCQYIPSTDPYCIVTSVSGDYWGDWYCNDPGNVVASFVCDGPTLCPISPGCPSPTTSPTNAPTLPTMQPTPQPDTYFTANYIVVNRDDYTWDEAEAFCNSEYNSHLATITSPEEDDELSNGIRHWCSNCFAWIGLSGVDCNFTWSSGQIASNYTNYGSGEPDHCSFIPSTDPYCIVASVSGTSEYWGDWYCNDPGNIVSIFVCDAEPTNSPSISPTTNNPSVSPTHLSISPSNNPSKSPSNNPSVSPTINPSSNPSLSPTISPTGSPIICNETYYCIGKKPRNHAFCAPFDQTECINRPKCDWVCLPAPPPPPPGKGSRVIIGPHGNNHINNKVFYTYISVLFILLSLLGFISFTVYKFFKDKNVNTNLEQTMSVSLGIGGQVSSKNGNDNDQEKQVSVSKTIPITIDNNKS